MRIADAQFRHFRPFSAARVLHFEGDRHWLIEVSGSRSDRQVALGEGCVRQAKSKGKEWFRF